MENNIGIRTITNMDICLDMLADFRHFQEIHKKWVKCNGRWELIETYELREWNIEKRIWISQYLKHQISQGGLVAGAYSGQRLIGFAAVDGIIRGVSADYANLTMLFVDDEWKQQGIGKQLFQQAIGFAAAREANKLFISAIPSHETIAFYLHMGCVDAKEIVDEFVDTKQDRYLEYTL